jgi:hypothetical protein
MSQTIVQIVDLGFSVADAENVTVSYADQALRVSFIDWREQPVLFLCHDTLAFRWQEAAYILFDTERDDSPYEIVGSAWLRQHEEQGLTWEGMRFRHYKLNFNAAGILEIICSRIERIAEPNDAPL